ncbi:rhodanese-like domain-containing protein [Dyella sp. BiH032]|uniref:rhodanese-like domain-containing protein n=1 Tax=Dyella sp. BiH032 TaxID=3075430 RepID=UPI002892A216|nr:rhodanese-like domain-containing protein [Dyella sp. BiH032]WNL45618.1 rhodanese-like domain-containing protein [Dyella sp. BiH032]
MGDIAGEPATFFPFLSVLPDEMPSHRPIPAQLSVHAGRTWFRRAAVCFLLALAGAAPAQEAPLTRPELLRLQQAGQAPLLLDVRRADEYRDGHIAGALNIPVEHLAERYTALGVPREREIVVYCASGRRAARAQALLAAQGYSHVRLLDGSVDAWRREQLPLVREGASHP